MHAISIVSGSFVKFYHFKCANGIQYGIKSKSRTIVAMHIIH